MTTTAGPGPHSRRGLLLTGAGTSSDGSGPYASAFGRLAAAGYPVVDGFVVRAVGVDGEDPAGLDSVGREEIATQLGALELRHGRKLGATSDPLRLAVLSLPKTLEVPVLPARGRATPPARHLVADDVCSVEALIAALRATAPGFGRRTVIVTVVRYEPAVDFAGTLVTRDPLSGTIATPTAWAVPPGTTAAGTPPRELQAQCDHIASAAEAACSDMCRVSVAIVDDVPTVTAILPAPRRPLAALRVAVDLRDHGLIASAEALRRVPLSIFAGAGAVPSAASTDVARLLRWADKATSVPVLPAADIALPRVRTAADVAALPPTADGVLVVPSGGPARVVEQLRDVADALDAHGVERVALELNRSLREAATTALPRLPWSAVAGSPDDPATRILAARLGAGG